jgi:uncharacterized protein (DUF1778 family)
MTIDQRELLYQACKLKHVKAANFILEEYCDESDETFLNWYIRHLIGFNNLKMAKVVFEHLKETE